MQFQMLSVRIVFPEGALGAGVHGIIKYKPFSPRLPRITS